MTDKLQAYHEGTTPIGNTNRLWPLYGAGLENLGQEGQPIDVPAPVYGPDELLIRHDAIGLCFSDTKVIKQGPNHPRIGRDMVKEPVVLGHEVSLTVVGVGENLRDDTRSAIASSSRPRSTSRASTWPTATGCRAGCRATT